MKFNFKFTTIFFSTLLISSAIFAQDLFPLIPQVELTPGSLCENPDGHRYPGDIPFCRRNVHSSRKWAIIRRYDEKYGYQVESVGRQNFKIDHLVPLCMGGSNEDSNLWPQHKSVYEQTDPWEQHFCIQIANGDITHQEALNAIYELKFRIEL